MFQCLTHTLDLPAEQWRVLDRAHHKHNLAEYEGHLEIDEALVAALIRVTISRCAVAWTRETLRLAKLAAAVDVDHHPAQVGRAIRRAIHHGIGHFFGMRDAAERHVGKQFFPA